MKVFRLTYVCLGVWMAMAGAANRVNHYSVDECKRSSKYYIKGEKEPITYLGAVKNPERVYKISVRSCPDTLPAFLFDFKNTIELDLDISVKLRVIPEQITQMKKVTKIVLTASPKMGTLPLPVCKMNALTELYINKCDLLYLPEETGQLKNLKILYIDGNPQLHSLPQNFGNLLQLETLCMFGTGITRLPSSFSKLKNLRYVMVLNPELRTQVLKALPHMQGENARNGGNPNIPKVR